MDSHSGGAEPVTNPAESGRKEWLVHGHENFASFGEQLLYALCFGITVDTQR